MIVEHSDLMRDLKFWETLSVASLMLRPVGILIHNKHVITIDQSDPQ
jgi:hypothetical protein